MGIIIFFLTIYRAKIGLYVFIFFLPLLNSLPKILGVHDISITLLLFFSLGLGFTVAIFKDNYRRRQFIDNKSKLFNLQIYRATLILSILIAISSLIVIYRYTNFYPFITNGYYDLYVNANKVGSTGSIFWTLGFFFNYIAGFIFFFVIINTLKNIKEVITAVIILISSTIISVFTGFYQHFFNPLFGNIDFWINMNRINATFTDPNSLGIFSLIVFPVFIGLIFYFKKWFVKLIIGLFLILFLVNMSFSGSRTAFLGLMISITFFAIIGLWKAIEKINMKFVKPARFKKVLLWLAVLVILIGLIFSILNFAPPLLEKTASYNILLERIHLAVDKLDTALASGDWGAIGMVSRDRGILWDQAVNMFKDYPISGIGVGAFVIELPNYYEKNDIPEYRKTLVDYSGNYYLQFLSELGLPGLILILFVFFMIIKKVSIYLKSQNFINGLKGHNWILMGLFISFVTMAITLIFGPHTNFNEIQFTFWLIIGLMLAIVMIEENRKKDLFIYDIDRIRFDFIDKIMFAILILVFAISTAVGSFTNLSINIKQNLYGYMNRWGYYDYQEEKIDDSVIAYRSLNTISSDVVEKKGQIMFFSIKAKDPDVYQDDLFVRFYIDNSLIKIVRLINDRWHYVELKIPQTGIDRMTFTVCISRNLIPENWNVPQHNKDPGIEITNLKFKNN